MQISLMKPMWTWRRTQYSTNVATLRVRCVLFFFLSSFILTFKTPNHNKITKIQLVRHHYYHTFVKITQECARLPPNDALFHIAFQDYANYEDWIIIDLRRCKSRLMSRNQLLKFNQPSNGHNFANTTQIWEKLPPKEVQNPHLFTVYRWGRLDQHWSWNKNRTLSIFQLHKHNMPLNAHSSANTTRN